VLFKKKKVTNGTRHQVNLKKFLLCKKAKIAKVLTFGKKNSQGRGDSLGRITIGHKGGGHKNLFRKIVFQTNNNFSILIAHMYDPRRSSFLSLCFNFLTKKFYNILSTNYTYPGSIIFSFESYPELRLGSHASVLNIPTGSLVHSLNINKKIKYIKSAGTFGVLIQKGLSHCKIKLPSGLVRKFPLSCLCFIGSISNSSHSSIVWGKAGRSRLNNKRPHVRGVAMNPVDHPHGGQTSGGIPSVTPWGIPTKGKPTRKKYV